MKQTNVFISNKQSRLERDKQETIENNGVQAPTIQPEGDNRNKPAIPKREKYERSGLTQERSQLLLKRLEEYTKNERPYLDANLTVDKLANQSHIPRHYLTQIFSEQLNKNFYLYINEYRVNKVKRLLNEPENNNMTLLEIAYESGFNSKSTFNSIFKKVTKMTPSQYKKNKSQF
ncbi:helix-turn-helix domain-containing protein [Psychromonas sp. KJ10-10]|uniref:helix-turn-helix domain-containing protein n=1 Tax=Psychromonas sp. KJ10-10 TaxID=3391823 RepID=UPI0039B493C5